MITTIVRFYSNLVEDSERRRKNPVITKTLMKLGVIHEKFVTPGMDLPMSKDYWKVRIVDETNPQRNTGVFLLEPLERIDGNTVFPIVPNLHKYQEMVIGGLLILMMDQPYKGKHLLVTRAMRNSLLRDRYPHATAVIVPTNPDQVSKILASDGIETLIPGYHTVPKS